MAYQPVVPARPNIWKANMKAINSTESDVNWTRGTGASVEHVRTHFRQLYNQGTQTFIFWTLTKEIKHGHPWIDRDIISVLRRKKKCWNIDIIISTSSMMERYKSTVNHEVATLNSTDWPASDIQIRPQYCYPISNISEHEP